MQSLNTHVWSSIIRVKTLSKTLDTSPASNDGFNHLNDTAESMMPPSMDSVMISTSSFSDGAHKYVERLDSKIILIDGDRLAALMIDHGVGVAMKQRYDVKVVDGDYFE